MLRCSQCGTENEDSARRCRECGNELSARDFERDGAATAERESVPQGQGEWVLGEASGTAEASATTAPVKVWCKACRRTAAPDADLCPDCGGELSAAEYGGFWQRSGGYIIDALITFVIAGVPALMVGSIIFMAQAPDIAIYRAWNPDIALTPEQLEQLHDARRNQAIASSIVAVVLALGYYVPLNARGATFGKRMVGLRVEDHATRDAIGYPRAFARYVVAIVGGLAILIGYLWCIWDEKKQTWHDKAAGSVVVRT